MNRIDRKHFVIATLLCLFVHPSTSAEFNDDDVLPEVASLTFARDTIAMTIESSAYLGHETKYFVADRRDLKFRSVSRRVLDETFQANHYHRQFDDYSYLNTILKPRYKLVQRDMVINRIDHGCAPDAENRNRITHADFELSVRLKCASLVVDAVRNQNELWIATFGAPTKHDFGKEGVVIISLAGDILKRVDIGEYPVLGLALDPWTHDVWIVSKDRITWISKDHDINRSYWPHYDFDEGRERPDMVVQSSAERLLSDPLAIIAYVLGESHYNKFFQAVQGAPDLRGQDLMYNYAMNGPDYHHQPLLPDQLNILIEDAEPTTSWRKFMCLLNDARAKQLCYLDLEQWPNRLN